MSGENRIINAEVTISKKKGEALKTALNEFNTEGATEDGCNEANEKE